MSTKKIHKKIRDIFGYVRSRRDNQVRRYHEEVPLEDILRQSVRQARDEWRRPYFEEYADDNWQLPDDQRKVRRVYVDPGDDPSVRDLLALDDSKFQHNRRYTKIRVPSMKRTDREWTNFYRTFPWLACEVATGATRFCNGAKLKYLPLFGRILDEEWPEELDRWTEGQYDKMIVEGRINR